MLVPTSSWVTLSKCVSWEEGIRLQPAEWLKEQNVILAHFYRLEVRNGNVDWTMLLPKAQGENLSLILLCCGELPAILGLPGWLSSKESACSVGDTGDASSILGWGRFPWGRVWPLQYSCLENPIDRGGWWATVCGVAKTQT